MENVKGEIEIKAIRHETEFAVDCTLKLGVIEWLALGQHLDPLDLLKLDNDETPVSERLKTLSTIAESIENAEESESKEEVES